MTKETTPVNLTESELKIIEIKRQEEKLEAEKKEVALLKRKEEKIAYMNSEANKFAASQKRLIEYAERILTTLNAIAPDEYQLDKRSGTKSFKAELHSWETENKTPEIIAEEIVVSYFVKILRIDSSYGITFEEKNVYSGNNIYSRRITGTKMVMHMDGCEWKDERKSYEKVVTIHKRITEKIKSANDKKKEATVDLIASEQALLLLTKKYPSALCQIGTDGYYVGHNRDWKSFKVIEVLFPNGFKVSYRYYGSGKDLSVSYLKTLTNPFTADQMIDFYSNLPKPEKK